MEIIEYNDYESVKNAREKDEPLKQMNFSG